MLSIRSDASIAEAVACIDRSRRIALAIVVDACGRLVNTISDGDVRRALLRGSTMSDSIERLLEIKRMTPFPEPVVASSTTKREEMAEIMRARGVRQLPVVDNDGRVCEIVTLHDLAPESQPVIQAVVMAGGFGTRLRPLTEGLPKPMLPVGGTPLMELIIGQLRETGITKINVTTHYKAEAIVDHFGDGKRFGVDISYVREESPLGTGGALGMVEKLDHPLLVINGDILTDIDFRAMHSFHEEHQATITVAVRRYEVQVPYGVVQSDGPRIVGLQEKPSVGFFVNAGIYMLAPKVHHSIPPNAHLNMTDLVERLLAAGETVVGFPVREYWLDIGQHADYERAQADASNGTWRAPRS